jgi:anti-anti-sigma factor
VLLEAARLFSRASRWIVSVVINCPPRGGLAIDSKSVENGYLWVRPEPWDSLFVLTIGGELDIATAEQFSRQAASALRSSRAPVLLDLHDLQFIDCAGAQALERVMGTVPPWQAVEVHGCQQAVRRVLDLLGLDLEREPDHSGDEQWTVSGELVPGPPGQVLRAQACKAWVHSQEAAGYASAVMARLAATYENLAHNSCYRAQGNEHDVGRLLGLSERASDLSARYQQHATTGMSA